MNDRNFSGAVRAVCAAAAAALMMSACGGDDDGAAAPDANNDSPALAAGETFSLLTNDTVNGAPATLGASANATLAITGTLPTGVTVADGVLSVGAAAAPGTVSFSYTLCSVADATACDTADVSLTVKPPAIVATADGVTVAAGTSADLLANDTLGGAPAAAATVTAAAVGALPTGVTLSAAGLLAVDATAAAGPYTLTYKICQTAAATNCAQADVSLTVPATSAVVGRAVDATTGLGIEGVTVRVAGTAATTTTAADGSFSLTVPAGAQAVVSFDAQAYVETTRTADLVNASSELNVRLLPVGTSSTVDAAAGGTVALSGSPGQVTLAANSIVRPDGTPPTGAVTVRLSAVAPAADSSVMPGSYTTMVGGAAVPIESFGALNVRLNDADGTALNLATGQTATIRIPVSTRSSDRPASVPLYYFDDAAGVWVEQGTATLAGTGTGAYYEGTVGHFTTWNADQVYDTVLVSGCVADVNGNRVAGAGVYSDGISYTGTSRAVTGADGSFAIPIRLGSSATLTGLSGAFLTNTLSVGPYSAETTLDGCLGLSQASAGITVKLTWGERPSDLDSHLQAPDGSEVYFGDRGSLASVPFANLDVDDTSSYGPEVVTITKLMVGTYRYFVDNYSGQSSGLFSASSARVELNIPGRAQELFVPPTTGESTDTDTWSLFELQVDASCNVTVNRVSAFATTPPTPATRSTPVYCTAP